MTEIVYDDLPEGLLTTLTYGLSLAEHPDWRHGSPELGLSVKSTNVTWAHAVGFLAEQLRGTCPFSYGSTIDFGERIVPESEMTAFCVFAPLALDRDDYLGIDVGVPGHAGHDVINIQRMYPSTRSSGNSSTSTGLRRSGRATGSPLTYCVAPQFDP